MGRLPMWRSSHLSTRGSDKSEDGHLPAAIPEKRKSTGSGCQEESG